MTRLRPCKSGLETGLQVNYTVTKTEYADRYAEMPKPIAILCWYGSLILLYIITHNIADERLFTFKFSF